MEDPLLNRNLEETREMQTRWSQFHDFCQMAMKGQTVTAQAELKFLELKSRIAMLHDAFMSGLKHSQKTGQNVMQIVSDSILLKRVAHYSEAERQKFEFDWNEAYLLMNEQVSSMEEEQKRLAAINERSYKAGKNKEMIMAKIYNLIHGQGLKYSIIFVSLVMVLYVVPNFIWSYRNFEQIKVTKPIYEKVVRYFYRPFLDHDLEFDSAEDIPRHPKGDFDADLKTKGISGRVMRNDNAARALTPDNFRTRVLLEIGGTAQNLKDLQSQFATNKWFSTEDWTADGQDVRIFFILFKSTADARKFVDTCQKGVQTYDAARKQTVSKMIYMMRVANLVGIGISEHSLRSSYMQFEFYVDNNPPSLLG